MRSWAVMAGVVGGVVVSMLLKYPLYNYLPGTLIPSWQQSSLIFSWVCIILAFLTLIATGIVGGRYSGFEDGKSHWGGAAAGAIAGMIAYGWIISSASGVYGNKQILEYGFAHIPDDVSFTWLVLYGVTDTLWWGSISFWLSIGIGATLGALGGWVVVPLSDAKQEWYFYFPWINSVILVLSLLSYIVTQAAYDVLIDSIIKSLSKAHFDPVHPIWLSILLIKMAGYFWYLFWQVKTWLDLRSAQQHSQEQHLSWVLLAFLALFLPLIQLLIFYGLIFKEADVFIACALSLVVGFFTFRDAFWSKRHFPMPAPHFSKLDLWLMVRGAVVLSIFVTLTFLTGGLSISLNLVLITIVAIGPLLGTSSFIGYHAMLDPVYTLPQTFTTGIFILTAGYLVLTIWTFSNTYNFIKVYGLRFKRDPEPDSTTESGSSG